MITEIVILAMIAAFLGLRLYSVLGRRSEHEEEVVPHRFDRGSAVLDQDHGATQIVQQALDHVAIAFGVFGHQHVGLCRDARR